MNRFGDWIFAHRRFVLAAFLLASLALGLSATRLGVDTSFGKHLPRRHPFMQIFRKHQAEFGGANRLLIAVRARSGDIFTTSFMETLKAATDAVFFLPGVNRASVRSLFTPNVRFLEIVEGGLAGGNVVPADYRGSAADLARVRANVLKAGIVGRLVANDLSAAMVSAELVEIDPRTGKRLDYLEVARLLEDRLREPFTNESVEIHIIGFAKAIGDVADGATDVLLFLRRCLPAVGAAGLRLHPFGPVHGPAAVVFGAGRGLDAGAAGAARFRHRPHVDPGALSRVRDRRLPRVAGRERFRGRDPGW